MNTTTQIQKNQTYKIKINQFPWTNNYANNHSCYGLWTEKQARTYLHDQLIYLTELITFPTKLMGGDRGISCQWARGIMQTGPKATSFRVMVATNWLEQIIPSAPTEPEQNDTCICPLQALMVSGCKCGGD